MEVQTLLKIFENAINNKLILKVLFYAAGNGYTRYACLPEFYDKDSAAFVFSVLSPVDIKYDFRIALKDICELKPITNKNNDYYKKLDIL